MSLKLKIQRILEDPRIVIVKLKGLKIQKHILRNYKKNPNNFFFIQIGSNDGVRGDPIYKLISKYKWKGILIEPVSYMFEKLKSTYQDCSGLVFENIAIANESGYKNFYRIKKNEDPKNPNWYDQIGSFNKEVVVKHRKKIPNFNKHFIQEKIKCITFQNLIKKNNVKNIDLLHIDTEGYDYEIIKTINFNETKPKMILYEHTHLSKLDKKACIDLLKKEGYKIFVNSNADTFAYL